MTSRLQPLFRLPRSAPVANQFDAIGLFLREALIEPTGQTDQRAHGSRIFPNDDAPCRAFSANDGFRKLRGFCVPR